MKLGLERLKNTYTIQSRQRISGPIVKPADEVPGTKAVSVKVGGGP
jgi:hypothetical protein